MTDLSNYMDSSSPSVNKENEKSEEIRRSLFNESRKNRHEMFYFLLVAVFGIILKFSDVLTVHGLSKANINGWFPVYFLALLLTGIILLSLLCFIGVFYSPLTTEYNLHTSVTHILALTILSILSSFYYAFAIVLSTEWFSILYIISQLMFIMYMYEQVYFLYKFSKYKMPSTWINRWIMVHFMAVNFCAWTQIVIQESAEILEEKIKTNEEIVINENNNHWHNNLMSTIQHIQAFCVPFASEYSLMVLVLYYCFWKKLKLHNTVTLTDYEMITSKVHPKWISKVIGDNYVLKFPEKEDQPHKTWMFSQVKFATLAGVIVAIVIIILYPIYIYPTSHLQNSNLYSNVSLDKQLIYSKGNVNIIFNIAIAGLIILSNIINFCNINSIHKPHVDSSTLKSLPIEDKIDKCLLIYTMTAVISMCGFSLIALIKGFLDPQFHDLNAYMIGFMIDNIIYIVVSVIQTSFLKRLLEFNIPSNEELIEYLPFKKYRLKKSSFYLCNWSIFCGIINIIIWIIYSYRFYTEFSTLFNDIIYTKQTWSIIYVLLFPFCVFYWFHSAVCLFTLGLEFARVSATKMDDTLLLVKSNSVEL